MRVAIAHPDAALHEALRRLAALDPAIELAWTTRDAEELAARCRTDRPDLLLLSLVLPGADVVELTRRVMRESPCAILLACDEAHAAASRAPYAALAAGALDAVSEAGFVQDPGGSALAAKLGQLRRILHVANAPAPQPAARRPGGLLVIGASTGGPAAIATILRALDAPLPVPCVVVQHIDAEFAPGMAAWLQTETGHAARLASGGETPQAGTVYLAGGGGHLVLGDTGRLACRREPVDSPYQPSIDEFFLSLRAWPSPALAVLLTGMGRDGARGLAALRARGWTTVAQAPGTCAVQGMPQAAIDLGAAQHILAPADISVLIRDLLRKGLP